MTTRTTARIATVQALATVIAGAQGPAANLLQSLADAPEGRALPPEPALLWLEFHDLVKSAAEPERRDLDRWTITDLGRTVLANAKGEI